MDKKSYSTIAILLVAVAAMISIYRMNAHITMKNATCTNQMKPAMDICASVRCFRNL